MLLRHPKTREILDSPNNAQQKQLLSEAIRAQVPLIEKAMRSGDKCSSIFWQALIESTISGVRMPMPVRPGSSITIFCQEVGEAWDSVGKEEMVDCGIPEEFSQKKAWGSIFSSESRLKASMGLDLERTVEAQAEVILMDAARRYSNGEASPEELDGLLRQLKGLSFVSVEMRGGNLLLRAEKNDDLLSTKNGAFIMNVQETRFIQQVAIMENGFLRLATRMCFGYNEEFWPPPGEPMGPLYLRDFRHRRSRY